MKILIALSVLCGVAVAFGRFGYWQGGRPNHNWNWRPSRPARPVRPVRPSRPQRLPSYSVYDIQGVISALGGLSVPEAGAFYCRYLGGMRRSSYFGWNGWRYSSAWQRLTGYYGIDKVKGCLGTYAQLLYNQLSSDGQAALCQLLSQLSQTQSQFCAVNVVNVLDDVCGTTNSTSPTTPTPTPPTTPSPTQAPTQAPSRDCGQSLLRSLDRRVIRQILTQTRIVGGTASEVGKYPFAVTVNIGNSLCGGTIINSTHVMTAAHCVDTASPGNTVVGVGEFDVTSNSDQTNFGVQSITIHPQYDAANNKNDIAILELNQPIDFDKTNSAPICLPEPGASSALDGSQNCVVAGWGLLSDGGILPNVLQEVTIPAYDGNMCSSVFGFQPTDPATQLCAGRPQGGIDSCQGDSGGPLMCLEGGSWVQYGIVSYGAGCASAGQPGIYTDVSQYVGNFI